MSMTNEELIDWLDEQATWVKDATITYYMNGEFTEKDIKRFGAECVEEASGMRKEIDMSKLNILTRDDRSNFSIKSIDNVIGVNALVSGKSLVFGECGITVIYPDHYPNQNGQDMNKLIIDFCREPRSLQEIMDKLGFNSRTNFRRK